MTFEQLHLGQTASVGKTITEADILMFAAVSTDTNPVHLNAEVAAASQFGERIAHGMLSAGLISAVLGTQLPGHGTIYMGQTLRFRAPVKIGDTVTATVEVHGARSGQEACHVEDHMHSRRPRGHRRRGHGDATFSLMLILHDWRDCPPEARKRLRGAGQFRRRASRPRRGAGGGPWRPPGPAARGAHLRNRIRASCSAPTIPPST